MKHVLFLAYLFPPIANSGTQRPLKFVKYLSAHGWSPIVLTAAEFDGLPTDPELLGDIPRDVSIVRVPMLNQYAAGLCRRALGERVGSRIGSSIRWRLQHRYSVPDWYALWKPMAVRAALRIFRQRGFDAIYATGFPWTSLLAGREIAAATGRPLIADFRDPWIGESESFRERAPHESEAGLERQVVADAHTVVTATTSMIRLMANTHPDQPDEKFVAIHNGFDAADLPAPPPRLPGQPFRIAFTGVWKNRYNPSDLYDSIDWIRRARPGLLDGVEVIAAGFPPGEARRRGLDSVIHESVFLPHPQAVALMQSSDVLFLPHTDPTRQWAVPAKMYEYLASARPVLALTDPDKETAQILRQVGGGIALSPEDPGTLYRALSEICATKRFDAPPRNLDALAMFERRQLTAKLAAILDGAYEASHAARADRAPSQSPSAGGLASRSASLRLNS